MIDEYYKYVYNYNSTTDKTKLITLETHRINNNNDDSLNANIWQVISQVKRNSNDDEYLKEDIPSNDEYWKEDIPANDVYWK